jgi:hypothetical protein
MRSLGMLLGVLCLFSVDPVHGADQRPSHAVFALIMGVNRSVDTELKPLLYADDDAVRYQELFRSLGAKTQLLARLDGETTVLSPQAAAEALPPTRASLRKVVAQLAAEIGLARQRGVKTSLYVLYAGHGNVDEHRSYLTLEDARLSGAELGREILDPINADENHLIVDACYSYLLVGERGPGGERHQVEGFSATSELAQRSNLGLLLSTSSGVESHEWGAFQAGVFSYEVRSGLYGAHHLRRDCVLSRAREPAHRERKIPPPCVRPRRHGVCAVAGPEDRAWPLPHHPRRSSLSALPDRGPTRGEVFGFPQRQGTGFASGATRWFQLSLRPAHRRRPGADRAGFGRSPRPDSSILAWPHVERSTMPSVGSSRCRLSTPWKDWSWYLARHLRPSPCPRARSFSGEAPRSPRSVWWLEGSCSGTASERATKEEPLHKWRW